MCEKRPQLTGAPVRITLPQSQFQQYQTHVTETSSRRESGPPSSTNGQPWTAWWSGRFVDEPDIRLPLKDAGISQGIMVCDTLRTFGGVPLLINEHLKRLENGCRLLGFGISAEKFADAIQQLVKVNRERAPAESDFRISLIATPGVPGSAEPTCIATVSLLDFSELQRRYREGISLAVVSTREIPENSIPRSMKHRNRIHYWLAEQEAGRILPGSRALLLDQHGSVCETTTTAIGFFKNRTTFVAPDEREILGSISLAKSIEFLKKAGVQVERARFSVEELLGSDEVLLFNALMPVAPVSRVIAAEKSREFDANWNANPPSGTGFGFLIDAWSEFSGVDLARQVDRGGSV